jgi:arylsulfatase A-like enzyme
VIDTPPERDAAQTSARDNPQGTRPTIELHAQQRSAGDGPEGRRRRRKILFVTTDQQRYDALGCNGGTLARTPVVDALAAQGHRYERAHPQSVVCMPSRSTIITGQHPSTHGVWMNGVALPVDAPSVAAELHTAGYRTALIGKPHFEPFLDPFGRFVENRFARDGMSGVHRGFEHFEAATHSGQGPLHYARWLSMNHPEAVGMFYPVLDGLLEVNARGGGDTGAPQVHDNPIPKEWYHTDWVADRTISWLDSLEADDDWFCWMSFPDPHHPWDPPASEKARIDWRDVPLPAGYVEDAGEREAILAAKPRHWRAWYDGTLVSNFEAPAAWVPATMTADQVREINATNSVECELIDEALGRVMDAISARGWGDDVDVIFTTDHGELQGDFGLMFKGPYHVDGLMRLPLIWRPAPSAGAAPSTVARPVGHVDLAPTFCAIAGLTPPQWMEGRPLPVDDGDADARGFERVLTEWDSELFGVGVHLRTITRDGWVCSTYQPGFSHDGTEGELYNLADDPLQRVNRWDDPACAAVRSDLLADLRDHQPATAAPRRRVEAPV